MRDHRIIRNIFFLFLMASLLFSSGCAAQYRQSIKDDFRDTFKIYAGVGIGIHADVKVTNLFHPGIGWGGYWMNVGLRDRYSSIAFPSIEAALFPLGFANVGEKDSYLSDTLRMGNGRILIRDTPHQEYFVSGGLFDLEGLQAFEAYGAQKISQQTSMFKSRGEPVYTEQPFGIELGFGLLFVNFRVGFDPVEFFDLMTTCFGWDMLQDNKSIEEESAKARVSIAPKKESVPSSQQEKLE